MTGEDGSAGSGQGTKSSSIVTLVHNLSKVLDYPVTVYREFFDRFRTPYPYYHQDKKRVPTIDECNYEDFVCVHEANEQYLRDRKVDKYVTQLMQDKVRECYVNEGPYEGFKICRDLEDSYHLALVNYYIKYGDIRSHSKTPVILAYMKQKHRLIWQRRNPGKDPIGWDKNQEIIDKVHAYQGKMKDNSYHDGGDIGPLR